MDFIHPYRDNSPRHRDSFSKRLIALRRANIDSECPVLSQSKPVESSGAAILRLPSEIMVEIFKFSQLLTYNHDAEEYKNYEWCWITLTHVCRYWRDIAIGTQELWTYINIEWHASPAQTSVFLERSGTSLLYVRYDIHSSNLEFLALVVQHVHRVRELHIQSYEHFAETRKIIYNPARQLEKLTLVMDSPDLMTDMRILFAGQAPKLTSLSLSLHPTTWENIPIMQNLRHLHISSRLDLKDLFHVISQLQNCEELLISTINHPHDTVYSPEGETTLRQIQVPSLNSLEISDANYTELFLLFNCIKFPAVIGWNIVCKQFPYKDKEIADPKVIPHIFNDNQGPFSLKLFIASDSVIITASPINAVADKYLLQRSVSYSWEHRPGLYRGESITLSDNFALATSAIAGEFWCSATELEVDVCTSGAEDLRYKNVDGDDWRPLLKLLPDVCKMTVRHVWKNFQNPVHVSRTETHLGLLDALGSSPEINGDGNVICPNLTELYLYGFNLWDRERAQRTIEPLKYRNECGKQLSLLCFTGLPMNQSTNANVDVLKDSGGARTIEVVV